jgi:Na+/H+-dicarboxylate symporter
MFRTFVFRGEVLLPLLRLAFLLGLNLDFDKIRTRPVVQLVDSLSRIFYQINSLVVELFGIGLIFIAASQIIILKTVNLAIFQQFITIIAFNLLFIVLGLYPLLLYLLGKKENPYKWLYANIGTALAAIVSGDEFLSIGMLIKHGKESLGIKRMTGSAVYPIFALFGRAGTALISSISFILIIRSYTSLEFTFVQVLWVMGFSIIVSFSLSQVPGMGAFIAISLLCQFYEGGLYQEGFLILKPISPILVSAAVFLDVITSSLVALLICQQEDLQEQVYLKDFV